MLRNKIEVQTTCVSTNKILIAAGATTLLIEFINQIVPDHRLRMKLHKNNSLRVGYFHQDLKYVY